MVCGCLEGLFGISRAAFFLIIGISQRIVSGVPALKADGRCPIVITSRKLAKAYWALEFSRGLNMRRILCKELIRADGAGEI